MMAAQCRRRRSRESKRLRRSKMWGATKVETTRPPVSATLILDGEAGGVVTNGIYAGR
ncbi:hypothetical protein SERLA73DRAFT_168093 [Serpula lacrymans var. lacrymans S7.3]|uniref:Uncharacterized protein n=2 Tax=Serpula lacrymans var. lacrymans TaxID=341189 RepID=F8PWJ2_SERL3|nr:uncharacterized protein SERLADRAFT_448783 [Serpula lacrymans var. lacrymans S7.9]EGO00316.1 hypothetical protein SERLA73DRAFT_168093 [Serpula lacrymans var. lacrymans S7.3]EGO25875.1 hypothetical protein SERLADRAFT_448783 [Serpula lacrymans var. lacrymans S7.9]